ncbi:MAG: SusC/RagA family TonB-linked outer membrane protein [Bacteroidaceae bacterium]|nr:SusC/RagA family TonB-linked outer membrane protein [Bacteroidaceae bacterium]
MNNNVKHFCKAGIAAMIFCIGVLPASAQDDVEEVVEEVAPVKKVKRAIKQYPMVEISGKVVDAATGEPLPGVKIKSYNNSFYAAMTDSVGNYSISVPTFVTSLSAALEDYNMTQVAINGRTQGVDIMLFSDVYNADYSEKTSGSRSVSTSGFDYTTSLTVDQEIQNRLGGDVRAISRSGIPGQGVSMFIEGFHSINATSQPLIVIDGVIHDQMYSSSMLHNGYYNNLLTTLNMDDVADVKILKNGTALYGAAAANGVILITTKRNTSMATRIDVNITGGVELIPSTPDVMNADQYRSYASGLLKTAGSKLDDFKFLKTDPNYYYYNMYHNNTDWKDVVYREAMTQNYGIHIQGGDDVANYNLSVAYMKAESTLKKNNMSRFNIRFNSDIVLTDKLTTRFDVSYVNLTRDLRDDGLVQNVQPNSISSPNALALVKSPFVAPYDFSTDGKMSNFISDADDYMYEALGATASVANPLGILQYAEALNKNRVDNTAVDVAITPVWHINRDMTIQEQFGYSSYSFDENYYTPLVGMANHYIQDIGVVTNTVGSNFSRHNAVQSDTRFSWNIPMGSHRLDFFGGVRYLSDNYKASELYSFSTGNDKTPSLDSSTGKRRADGIDDTWKSITWYGDFDYNFREKYYLHGILALESSSRFGKDAKAGIGLFGVRWGFFPSIQAAWVISNENWFRPNNGVNMLKVNAGFESVGNDSYDNNAAFTYMSSRPFLQEKAVGIGITNIGNTKLRWETTDRFNAGFEGVFFNNRLNVKFNYFYSTTSNLVTLGTIAYVTGLKDYWTNDGAMKNQGFDVAAEAKLVNKQNFKFTLGASVGHYKNKITQLPENAPSVEHTLYSGTILTKVGSPLGMFYGFKTNGVYSTSAEAAAEDLGITNAAGNKVNFGAGDMRFVDTNGDGIISDGTDNYVDDRVFIGDPNPDIYGNIHANFFLGKNWAIGLNFNYSLGNDIYNFQRAVLEGGHAFLNQSTALNRRWIAEGQTSDIPQAVYGDPMGNSRFSDRWIEDGSYLKLKNVTVSYKLPISDEYFRGLTIWAAANNLFTLTKYLGSDPEVSCGNGSLLQGIDAGFTPAGRSFTLGVKINL